MTLRPGAALWRASCAANGRCLHDPTSRTQRLRCGDWRGDCRVEGGMTMSATKERSMYRAPAGRPVSYPPMECLTEAETFTSPPIAIPTGRAAGAFVLRQKLADDPEFRAEYSRKVSAGMIAHHRRRAALKAQPDQAKKWHTYA